MSDQIKINIHNKTLYKVDQGTCWSIVIMPDNIVIDNYHNKGSHIHPNPTKHEEEIKIKNEDVETNFKIVFDHLDINTDLFIEKLIKELTE